MTVSSTTDRATFPGNDATQIFPLPFRFFANSEIQAWLVTNATGALTALALGTHYTLSGAGDPEVDGNATGELTMLTAPTSLQSLFVQRVIPLTQPTDIVNQGRFFPEIHENVFDRLTMLMQQAIGESEGAIRVAIGDPEPARLAPAVSRANQLMGFDSAGNPIAVAPVSGDSADLALSLANDVDPAKGSGQVGFSRAPLASIIAQVSKVGFVLSAAMPSLWEYIGAITDKPTPADPSTWDWSPAVQAAFDVGGPHWVPVGRYPVRFQMTATLPVQWLGAGYASSVFIPDVGGAAGKVFAFETDDVVVDGIGIDGTGLATIATANHYAFFGGDGVTQFKNHTYKNCGITNWNFSDGLIANSNLLVSHGFYVDNVDNVSITDNVVDTMSGAAIFCRDIDKLTISRNKIHNSIWYPIHLAGGCFKFEVSWNQISSLTVGGIFWGGAIDLMSQHIPLEERNRDGIVCDNTITGTISYGTPIRVMSAEDVTVCRNTLKNWSAGTWAASGDLTGIRIDTRGTATDVDNGPCINIHVYDNTIKAPTGADVHRGIYATNQFQSARTPFKGLWIHGNKIESANNSTTYFANAISLHGFAGGFEDVHVYGNECSVVTQAGTPVPGAIGFLATNADGGCRRIFIGKNVITDLGTPVDSNQTGYAFGQFTDQVFATDYSIVENFFFGLRTFANSGPTLVGLDNFYSIGNTTRAVYNVPLVDVYGNALQPTIASSSALAVPQFEGPLKTFKVSGTTTVSSIPATGQAGKSIVLIFTGALTVNDGSNLLIAGNFVTAANSTLSLSCDGTSWFETGRSSN